MSGSGFAVVGAGVLGRLMALRLAERGSRVTLFEKDYPERATGSACSYTGAGMLAPYSELESAEREIFELGKDSAERWAAIAGSLSLPVFLQAEGTLIVSHALDLPYLARLERRLRTKLSEAEIAAGQIGRVDNSEIERLEPALALRFNQGLYIAREGQIDNRQLLQSLLHRLAELNVGFRPGAFVSTVSPHTVECDGMHDRFDMVFDCRGLGAREDLSLLRGVRGELIDVLAPEVELGRPVRLMHPRYPLYLVPRPGKRFLVGATSIESDDHRPISVQSALELLSAAYSVHPGFADASIVEMRVSCRPALPDNLPRVFYQEGLIRINGLHRHGFLLAPKLTEMVADFIAAPSLATDSSCLELTSVFEFAEEQSRHASYR